MPRGWRNRVVLIHLAILLLPNPRAAGRRLVIVLALVPWLDTQTFTRTSAVGTPREKGWPRRGLVVVAASFGCGHLTRDVGLLPPGSRFLGAASVRPRVAVVHVHVPQPCLRVRPPGTLVRLPLARVRLRFAPAGRRSDLSRQRTTRVWRAEPHGARVPLRARRVRPLGDQADRLGRRRRQPARLDLSLVGSRGALPAASFAGSRSLAGPLPFCFGLLAKRRSVLPLDSLFRPLCALGDVMRRTILQFACVCRILTFICDPFGSSAKASRRSGALDRNARWCAKRSTPSVSTSLLAANPSRRARRAHPLLRAQSRRSHVPVRCV